MKALQFERKLFMKKMLSEIKSGLKWTFLVLLCVGILVGANRYRHEDPNQPSTSKTDEVEILSRGIKARMLSSNTNSYGEKDQVFSYSFSPSNATNQQIEISMTYSDETDCSEVMEYSLDATNKQVTLSCKAAFSKQINVVLKSKANENATATIVLDYVKKLKNVTFKTNDFIYINDYAYRGTEYTKISSFQPETFFTTEYSIYTKDASFSYNMEINELTLTEKTVDLSEDFINTFASNVKSRVNSHSRQYFRSSEIWSMATSNADKSLLKAITTADVDAGNGYLSYTASVEIIESRTSATYSGTLNLYFSMYGSYSGSVDVDAISAETSTLEF